MLQIEQKTYTFDDVLLVPGYSNILPKDVNLKTKISKNISLNIPIISAAMDTVTELNMAIAMAIEGGIGIIHKNMSPKDQANIVYKVKRHESGIVKNPITVKPNMKIAQFLNLTRNLKISGIPIIDNNQLVGLVTNRDIRFETNLEQEISSIMTKKDELITILEGSSIDEARSLMHKHKIERILIVNNCFELKGLVTVKDLTKNIIFPNANKDKHGQLIVGAAVGIGRDNKERVELLVDSGVDVIVVDTAHGHSQGVIDQVHWIKNNYPQIDVIGGNIATADAARALVEAGADGVKVGIGPGSICTTRIVAGIGVPQLSAINNVSQALMDAQIPLIADGGIRYSGDVAKALAAGASSVMLGSILAGTDESPGEIELYKGRSYKSYRGMGSISAMSRGSADRYFQETEDKFVPEGIEGRVACKGALTHVIHQISGGLRSAMGYLGTKNISQMHKEAKFVEITTAGIRESHVHDVQIVKEAPNYNIE